MIYNRLFGSNLENVLQDSPIYSINNLFILSRNLRKQTFWHMRKSKTLISLHTRAVWSSRKHAYIILTPFNPSFI